MLNSKKKLWTLFKAHHSRRALLSTTPLKQRENTTNSFRHSPGSNPIMQSSQIPHYQSYWIWSKLAPTLIVPPKANSKSSLTSELLQKILFTQIPLRSKKISNGLRNMESHWRLLTPLINFTKFLSMPPTWEFCGESPSNKI